MSWLHLGDTQPKARKRHICDLCELPIEPGTVHVARRGIGDDGPVTSRMHLPCEQMTRDERWDDADWECHDRSEFRARLKQREPTTL